MSYSRNWKWFSGTVAENVGDKEPRDEARLDSWNHIIKETVTQVKEFKL